MAGGILYIADHLLPPEVILSGWVEYPFDAVMDALRTGVEEEIGPMMQKEANVSITRGSAGPELPAWIAKI